MAGQNFRDRAISNLEHLHESLRYLRCLLLAVHQGQSNNAINVLEQCGGRGVSKQIRCSRTPLQRSKAAGVTMSLVTLCWSPRRVRFEGWLQSVLPKLALAGPRTYSVYILPDEGS